MACQDALCQVYCMLGQFVLQLGLLSKTCWVFFLIQSGYDFCISYLNDLWIISRIFGSSCASLCCHDVLLSLTWCKSSARWDQQMLLPFVVFILCDWKRIFYLQTMPAGPQLHTCARTIISKQQNKHIHFLPPRIFGGVTGTAMSKTSPAMLSKPYSGAYCLHLIKTLIRLQHAVWIESIIIGEIFLLDSNCNPVPQDHCRRRHHFIWKLHK